MALGWRHSWSVPHLLFHFYFVYITGLPAMVAHLVQLFHSQTANWRSVQLETNREHLKDGSEIGSWFLGLFSLKICSGLSVETNSGSLSDPDKQSNISSFLQKHHPAREGFTLLVIFLPNISHHFLTLPPKRSEPHPHSGSYPPSLQHSSVYRPWHGVSAG